jgi:hypothetical protein
MKIQTTALMLMTGLLAFINLPALAQEKPATPPERPRGDMNPVREPERALEKPVAYLGVLTGPVSRELRAQFALAEGFGLQVAEVMPDSPAHAAGLKEHDVLVNFEDQKLVNMEQLQTLVRSKKKDDTVNLSVITSGEQKQISVKIGERMARIETERNRGGFPPPGMQWFGGGGGSPFGNTEELREQAEQFQRRVREYQEQMQDWARDGRRGNVPPPPMFDGPRREGDRRPEGGRGGPPRDGDSRRPDSPPRGEGETRRIEHRESHESASITRSDETGIYSLRKDGERAVFSVKPKDGEEKTWPVNTEDERAAVPEPYRTKLREMEDIRSSVRRDGGGPPRESSRDDNRRPEGARDAPPPGKRPDGI